MGAKNHRRRVAEWVLAIVPRKRMSATISQHQRAIHILVKIAKNNEVGTVRVQDEDYLIKQDETVTNSIIIKVVF